MAKTPKKKVASKSKSKKTAKKKAVTKKKARTKVGVKRTTIKRRTPALAGPLKTPQKWTMRMATITADDSLPLQLPKVEIPRDQIAKLAYELWEERVRLANDATRNWLDAEEQLQNR
jgi:hypothetical protein